MLVQTMKRSGVGLVLGMAVGNLIACLTGHSNIVSHALLERAGSLSTALLWQTLLSGVIGAAGFGGTVLYDSERLSLLGADALHYVIYMAVFLPAAFFLGWTETAGQAAVMAAVLLAVHTVIFLIMCARYRAEARELNELNERRKSRRSQQIGGAI